VRRGTRRRGQRRTEAPTAHQAARGCAGPPRAPPCAPRAATPVTRAAPAARCRRRVWGHRRSASAPAPSPCWLCRKKAYSRATAPRATPCARRPPLRPASRAAAGGGAGATGRGAGGASSSGCRRHLPFFLLDRPRLPPIARRDIASFGWRAPIAATLRATRLVCGVGAAARRGAWLSHAEVLGQPGVRPPCARARSPRRWCTAPPYRSSDQRARGLGRGRARARATCERDVAVCPGAPRRRKHLAIVLLPSPPSAIATVFRPALLPRHMPRLACGDPRLGRAGPRASGGLFTRFEDPRVEKGGTTCHLSVGKVHASPSPPDSWSGFDHSRVPNFCPTALFQCHRGFALEVGAHPLMPLLCAIMFPRCRSCRI